MAIGPVYPKTPKGSFSIGGRSGGGRSNRHPAPATQKPPKTQNHPTTQMPVMPSEHELRAKANADAWKSIQQMQATLPSTGDIMARYGAQRSAIEPLVSAHRDWLEKAGEYQVGMTNALSSLVQQGAATGDATAGAGAAAAGAPMGSAPATNVAPAASAMPVAAYGTSSANYLRSLVPYATAQGIGNIGRVNQAENEEMQSVSQARAKIGAELPGLRESTYTDSYNAAFQKYKGELATLASRQKGDLNTLKTTEKIRNDRERLRISAQNADTSAGRRSDAAIRAANVDAKGEGTRTAGDASNLKAGLAKALEAYNDTGGTSGYGRFGVTMKSADYKDALGRTHKGATEQISGANPQEVRNRIAKFLKAHKPITEGPNKGQGAWSQWSQIEGLKGYQRKVGQKGEYNRRQTAWGIFKAANAATLHPVSTEKLREMFQYAIPKK